MYKIFADDVLIYDSTLEDFKIGKGQITKEVNKSGSFVFSLYPDHPYYDGFVKLKTVVTVYKSGRIVFRGRVLNDVTDYWNNKVLTCEGELGFLQDSIIRPYEFSGTPADLLRQLVENHNGQVDEFKRFKVGTCTVEDANGYIVRSSDGYDNADDTLANATVKSSLGGYIHITHGDDGTDPVPTIHWLADFTETASQVIEFGANLKDYTKKGSAEETATAIIPLGAETSSGGPRLTIESVNGGVDYIYDETAQALRGWVFKTVTWDDVTLAQNLLDKARAYLAEAVKQSMTLELKAIDLHLLDRSIESYHVGQYVPVRSVPHKLDAVLLCNKQTLDLLDPGNDTVTLGYQTTTFTDTSRTLANNVATLGRKVSTVAQDAESIKLEVKNLDTDMESRFEQLADGLTLSVSNGSSSSTVSLNLNGVELSSQTIRMSGLVTYSGLANGTTTINGGCIETDSVYADALHLGGEMAIYRTLNSTTLGGYIGYCTGYNSDSGVGFLHSVDAGQCICTDQGARLSFGGDSDIYVDDYAAYMDGATWCIFAVSGQNYMCMNDEFLRTYDSPQLALGHASYPWSAVYADTGEISTSDARKKNGITYDELDKYEQLHAGLKPGIYKLNNGTSGRYHFGFIAQDVEQTMADVALDSTEFGAFIKSPVYEKMLPDGTYDKTSDIVDYDYALRYSEFVALNTLMIQKLTARVAELEAKIA